MDFRELMTEIGELLATPLYTIGGTQGTVGTALTAGLIVLATWWLTRLLGKGIKHAFERREIVDEDTARPYIRVAQILVLAVGLGVAFNTLGFQLTAIFAAGGLFLEQVFSGRQHDSLMYQEEVDGVE